MSKRNIIIEPDPVLRKKSNPLEKVDDELRKLLDDMLETVRSSRNWISCSTSWNFKTINCN